MCAVDARVDYRDSDRREGWRLEPGVERSILDRVPLSGEERVVGHVGGRPTRQGLHVPRPPHAAEGGCVGGRDGERPDRREVDDSSRSTGTQPLREVGAVGARGHADAEPPCGRRLGTDQGERGGGEQGSRPRAQFASPGGTVIVSAGPAWPSAVRRYVAVAFGRTVTANTPSTSGDTLTAGNHAPFAPSF